MTDAMSTLPTWWGFRERGREYVHVTGEQVARRVCDNSPERYELVACEVRWLADGQAGEIKKDDAPQKIWGYREAGGDCVWAATELQAHVASVREPSRYEVVYSEADWHVVEPVRGP